MIIPGGVTTWPADFEAREMDETAVRGYSPNKTFCPCGRLARVTPALVTPAVIVTGCDFHGGAVLCDRCRVLPAADRVDGVPDRDPADFGGT
jgi:hypothetical protein